LVKRLKEVSITEAQLPYTVAEGVSVERYNELLMQDHRFKAMLEWNTNKILIVELPGSIHDGASRALHHQISPLGAANIFAKGSGTVASNLVPPGASLQADESYCPNNWGPPPLLTVANWVTLVIEVTASGTLAAAERKARCWLTETSCQQVILIAFSPTGQSLRAWVYHPPVVVGGAIVAAQGPIPFGAIAGLGVATLQIPLATLFGGAVHIPAAFPAAVLPAIGAGNLMFDLFPVKQAILRALQ